jgi:hypothetical protein
MVSSHNYALSKRIPFRGKLKLARPSGTYSMLYSTQKGGKHKIYYRRDECYLFFASVSLKITKFKLIMHCMNIKTVGVVVSSRV